MPVSQRPQCLRRRRVGALVLGGIALFQLLLPAVVPNGGKPVDSALAPGDWAPLVGVPAIILLSIVGVYIAMNRRRLVCDQIVATWRALQPNSEGYPDREQFEAGTKKIFGDRQIEFAELTYLHGLIRRLDEKSEDGPTPPEDLSAGLQKVLALVGGKPVETADDLCAALKKLSDAANGHETDAAEAEVMKEMSQKSLSRKSLSQRSLSQKSLSQNQKSPSQKSMSQRSVTGADRELAA